MDHSAEQKDVVEIQGWVFILLFVVSFILPPIGLIAALVLLTTFDETRVDRTTIARCRGLIAVSIAAFIIQITLGVVYLVPLALEQVEGVFKPFLAESPYSGYGGPPGREAYLSREPRELMGILQRMISPEDARRKYDEASKAIDAGSKDPFDYYIAAAILLATEVGDELIEDDDERRDEMKRLILEGLAIDGEDPEVKKYLDVMMLTPLMSTQLDAGEYQDADATYNKLAGMEGGGVFEQVRLSMEHWAYNSRFEYWQIRKPDKAFDISLATIRQIAWTGERLQLNIFDYPYYGGLDQVYELSERIGKEDEFFNLLRYFITTIQNSGGVPADEAESHQALARYLEKSGQLDESLYHYRKARELDRLMPVYFFNEIVADFNSGHRQDAAELLFLAALDTDYSVSMDNMRFIFAEYPDEGIDFLSKKIAEYPDRPQTAANLAILAVQSGRMDLARTVLRLMETIQSGEEFSEEAQLAAKALASGDVAKAAELLPTGDGLEKSDESAYVRAMITSISGDRVEIATTAAAAIEVGPYERELDFPLFETYFKTMSDLGKTDEAVDFLRKIAKENPGDPYPLYFLGIKLREYGMLDESREAFTDLLSKIIPMRASWMQFQSFIVEGSAAWWFQRLNWVDAADIHRELGIVAKLMGDYEALDHHIFQGEGYRPEDFGMYLLSAERQIQKGKLKEAGEILDDISFSPLVDDRNGQPYRELMAAYAKLKAAGWVRDRNFKPYL